MPFHYTFILTCFLITLSMSGTAYARQTQSSDVLSETAAFFAKRSFVLDISISPDGRKLMVAAEMDEDQTITFLDTVSMEALEVVDFDSRWRLGRATWISNDSLIVSPRYRPMRRNYSVPTGNLILVYATGKRPKALFGPLAEINKTGALAGRVKDRLGAVLLDPLPEKKDQVLVQVFDPNRTGFAELNVRSGRLRGKTFAPSQFCRFSVDKGGQVRFCSMQDPMTDLDKVYELTEADWNEIYASDSPRRARVLGGSTDTELPLVLADAGSAGTQSLYSLESFLKGGPPLFSDPLFDFWDIKGLPASGVYAITNLNPFPTYIYPDSQRPLAQTLSRMHKSLAAAFPSHFIDFTSHDAALEKFIVRVSSDTLPGRFFLFDQKTNELRHLSDSRPWLKDRPLAEKQPITFRTEDGLTLHGFLTRAIAETPKKAPSIILVHGGPHGPFDTFHYDHEVQFLAALGLNVVQINFRGSGGFGQAFVESGYLQWSRLMVDDVIAGFMSLAGEEVSEDACIYGASYGAFNALSAAFREPDTFVCAAGHVGVYSLPELFKDGDISDEDFGLAYLKRVLGQDSKVLRADSPAFNAEQIHVPVFLSAGEDDVRAPQRQTKIMAAALKAAGKEVSEMYIDKEGHGFVSAENETNRLIRLGNFFAEHLLTNIKPLSPLLQTVSSPVATPESMPHDNPP